MQTPDSTHTIQRSAARFFSGTLISRITGMLRDMAMAFSFGTESAIATFMVAFRFAHLARRLFGEGSLQNTFIPHFEELRHVSESKALSFFKDLSISLVIVTSSLALLGILALTFILYSFSFSETTALLLKLTAWMLPSLVFITLYGLTSALLECEKSYFTPSIAPVAFNAVWILAALLFGTLPVDTAVIALAIAVSFACFMQLAVTLPKTFQILNKEKCGPMTPFSSDVRRLAKPLFLANLGVAASQVNNALDPLFSLYANLEGPALLWYAVRVQQLPLALFAIALSGALLPPISRAIKTGNLDQFHEFFSYATKKMGAITLFFTAGILATAPSVTNLLFGRGAFDMTSVEGTARCLVGYGLGLYPMAYILIAAPALYAFNDYKSPARASMVAMGINICLNALFVFIFKWGAESVAIATSLASVFNAWTLKKALLIRGGKKDSDTSLSKIALVGGAGILAVFAVDLIYLHEIPALQLLRGIPLNLSQDMMSEMVHFSLEGTAFLAGSFLAAYFLKVTELFSYRK